MNTKCTVYKTADFIGKRWTLPILHEIYKGKGKKRRYSELKKALPGITAKMLSERLRELEKHKMISKKIDSSVVPIKSTYSLTKSGAEFTKILQNMKEWALKWNVNNKHCTEEKCSHCKF